MDSYYQEIKEKALIWDAKFAPLKDVHLVANQINLPHEDYPQLVSRTEELINKLVSDFRERGHARITVFGLRALHEELLYDDVKRNHLAGNWRTWPVKVNEVHVPPLPFLIPELVEELINDQDNLSRRDFYRVLQTIHPFGDGNGRIGGILLAAQTYVECDVIPPAYMVPGQ